MSKPLPRFVRQGRRWVLDPAPARPRKRKTAAPPAPAPEAELPTGAETDNEPVEVTEDADG